MAAYAHDRDEVEWRTPRPLAVGRGSPSYEVVEHVPGEPLVMRTADGPFPIEMTYAWADARDGRTRMTLRKPPRARR